MQRAGSRVLSKQRGGEELQTELESTERTRSLVRIEDQQGAQVLLYKESHALVIGVSNYTSSWPKLPGVQHDVQEVKAVLEEHDFNVTVKMDPDKTPLNRPLTSLSGPMVTNRKIAYWCILRDMGIPVNCRMAATWGISSLPMPRFLAKMKEDSQRKPWICR
ncbi:MAG: caspase family protein [bacterium]|nr:caspase family protein [bacterium]